MHILLCVLTGLTLVLSSSMSSFAASDSSPLIVLVSFRGDNCRLSRASLSRAVRTGLPPTVDEALDCPALSLPLVEALPLKVLSCFGLVDRLTTPPRPTFRVTFLFDAS